MRRRVPGRFFAACLALAGALGCSKSDKATPLAPPSVELDGLVFNQIYSCSESPASGVPFCADHQVLTQLQFTKTSSNTYRVRNVPDTGLVYNGTLSGAVYTWNAVSPNGYTETGSWSFTSDGASFAGISHYIANDDSYSGDCSSTGARAPGLPPAPSPIGACP